jgi:hypothetical protein
MGVQNLSCNPPFSPQPHSSQIKCKILFFFLLLSFYIIRNKNLNTNLYLRLIYLQFYNMIILQFASNSFNQ